MRTKIIYMLIILLIFLTACSTHTHKYEEKIIVPTCTEKGYTLYTCNCGVTYKDQYIEQLEHIYDDWIIIKEPTESETGIKEKICKNCNNKISESIAKIENKLIYILKDDYYIVKAASQNISGEVNIPEMYKGLPVKEIADEAFLNCQLITNVTMSNNIINIGKGAFQNCTKLNTINLSNNITEIRFATFSECSSITNIILPSSVTKIGDRAFYKCTNLVKITITKNITNIITGAFDECTNLKTVNYTGTVEEWKEISIGSFNKSLTNAEIIYNYK